MHAVSFPDYFALCNNMLYFRLTYILLSESLWLDCLLHICAVTVLLISFSTTSLINKYVSFRV